MLEVVLLAALIAGANPAPQPSSTPLGEIPHVATRPLCVAIHDRIAPSVAALTENDVTITDGIKILKQYARPDGHQPLLGALHLEKDASSIAGNLDAIDALLKDGPDAARLEANDRDSAELLKGKVRSVTDAERSELNILNGTIQSAQMSNATQSGDPFAVSNLGAPGAPADPSASATSSSSSSFGPSAMASVAQAAVHDATVVLSREQDLIVVLQPLAAECNSPVPALDGPAASPP
jgi:hypothetical protein